MTLGNGYDLDHRVSLLEGRYHTLSNEVTALSAGDRYILERLQTMAEHDSQWHSEVMRMFNAVFERLKATEEPQEKPKKRLAKARSKKK